MFSYSLQATSLMQEGVLLEVLSQVVDNMGQKHNTAVDHDKIHTVLLDITDGPHVAMKQWRQ